MVLSNILRQIRSAFFFNVCIQKTRLKGIRKKTIHLSDIRRGKSFICPVDITYIFYGT